MSFKLIAIRPLPGNDEKFLKNLQPFQVYKFYNEYSFDFKDDDWRNEVIQIIQSSRSIPDNLYDVGRLKINISALVGKNGSGKSSLLELFFWSINNLATNFLYDPKKPENLQTKGITANLKFVDDISVEFFFACKAKNSKSDDSLEFYKILTLPNSDRPNYSIQKQLKNSSFKKVSEIPGFRLQDLFYTEVINYSHYAYNSVKIGKWIDGLFHKNDSYQTPLVLNPMRTRGDFEIERENDLIGQRLLVNLLRPAAKDGNVEFRKFGDNGRAVGIQLQLKDIKTHFEYEYDRNKRLSHEIELKTFYDLGIDDEILLYLIRFYKRSAHFQLNYKLEYFDHVKSYILYKIISISEKYTEYQEFFDYFKELQRFMENRSELDPVEDNEVIEKLQKFPVRYLKALIKDESHITFKLKQSLNYLTSNELKYPIDIPIDIEIHSRNLERLKSILPLLN